MPSKNKVFIFLLVVFFNIGNLIDFSMIKVMASENDNAIRAVQLTAKEHYKQGLLYYELAEYESASRQFEKAVNLNPQNGIYYFNLAMAYFNGGYYQYALEAFQRAGEFTPKLAVLCRFYQGIILFELGEYASAEQLFQSINNAAASSKMKMKASKMLARIKAKKERLAVSPKKWDASILMGTELDSNITTEFSSLNENARGDFLDLNLSYRPAFWSGMILKYTYSGIKYAEVSSANLVAQTIGFEVDKSLEPFFYYSYDNTNYWLAGRPYYQAHRLKLMWNYELLPFSFTERTGLFISGEQKNYLSSKYQDYNMHLISLGAQQELLFNVQAETFYSWANSAEPENHYESLNYQLFWLGSLAKDIGCQLNWQYEFRPYYDYYGFYREDIYQEVALSGWKQLNEMIDIFIEKRFIRNDSNVDFKEYEEELTTMMLAINF